MGDCQQLGIAAAQGLKVEVFNQAEPLEALHGELIWEVKIKFESISSKFKQKPEHRYVQDSENLNE